MGRGYAHNPPHFPSCRSHRRMGLNNPRSLKEPTRKSSRKSSKSPSPAIAKALQRGPRGQTVWRMQCLLPSRRRFADLLRKGRDTEHGGRVPPTEGAIGPTMLSTLKRGGADDPGNMEWQTVEEARLAVARDVETARSRRPSKNWPPEPTSKSATYTNAPWP
jgi:hypothetical protein